jgi:hypothetical protein
MVVITEKIDGTNSQVWFMTSAEFLESDIAGLDVVYAFENGDVMLVGSRKKFITPRSDNFGFARWAVSNANTLFADLGYGQHFGEWWGQGIQRGYGLDHKRFSLFNTSRWAAHGSHDGAIFATPNLGTVPVLYEGLPSDVEPVIDTLLETLADEGSYAAPGFDDPEGLIIYHTAAHQCFKVTLQGDDNGKGTTGAG